MFTLYTTVFFSLSLSEWYHSPYFTFVAIPVKPKLKDILTELYTKAASKWKDIGILLGIDSRELDALKAMESHFPQSCLRGMFEIYLKRINPLPSWSAIAEALELLGDEELATQLRSRYCEQCNQ